MRGNWRTMCGLSWLEWKTSFLFFCPAYWPDLICSLRFWQILFLDPTYRTGGRPWPGHCCYFFFNMFFYSAARGTSLWGQSTKRPFGSVQGPGQHQNWVSWPAHTGAFPSAAGHFVPLLNSGTGWAVEKRGIWKKENEIEIELDHMVSNEEDWTWEKRVWFWKADIINRSFLFTLLLFDPFDLTVFVLFCFFCISYDNSELTTVNWDLR